MVCSHDIGRRTVPDRQNRSAGVRKASMQSSEINNAEELLKEYVSAVPDFPEKGVIFRDITPLLLNPEMYKRAIEEMTAKHMNKGVTKIVALESRGFIFAPIALQLNAGLVIVRKSGKLPRKTFMMSYELEYGNANIELHADCMDENDVALVVDDVLATGGTAEAAGKLTALTGAKIAGYQFLIELDALNGRQKLKEPVYSVLHY